MAWVAAAGCSALICLIQYFGWADLASPWLNVPPPGEAFGNLRQRNQMATLTAIGVGAVVWWGGSGLRSGTTWVLLGLLAFANAATASRTGLVQLVALAVIFSFWSGSGRLRRMAWMAWLLACYGLAVMALPRALNGLTGLQTGNALDRFSELSGCTSRGTLWSNVLDLIALRPWNGWGPGELDYAHFMTPYTGERFCDILDNAHNLPLHLAVEFGIPLAAIACLTIIVWVWHRRPWCETDPMRQTAWAVLFVIAVHSLLEYPLWYGPFQIAAILALLMLSRVKGTDMPIRNGTGGRFTRRLRTAIAVGGLGGAMIGLLGWDYLRASQVYLAPEQRLPAYRDSTLDKARETWFFGDQVRFAELTMTPTTEANASWVFKESMDLLHFSPEPRVIERVIESSALLNRTDVAVVMLDRYRRAFPNDYRNWRRQQSLPDEVERTLRGRTGPTQPASGN